MFFVSQKLKDFCNFVVYEKPKTVLIRGIFGTGKTCTAKYVAEEYSKKYGGVIKYFNFFNSTKIESTDIVIVDDVDKDGQLKVIYALSKIKYNLLIINSWYPFDLFKFDAKFHIKGVESDLFENQFPDLALLLSQEQKQEILTWPLVYVDILDTQRHFENFNLNAEIDKTRLRLSRYEEELL